MGCGRGVAQEEQHPQVSQVGRNPQNLPLHRQNHPQVGISLAVPFTPALPLHASITRRQEEGAGLPLILLDDADALHGADFGLARLMDQGNRLTLSHSVMGTPAYMAPEQAIGNSHRVGTPADLYALGAILYEMLTGRPPFLADTAMETLRLVAEADPENPRRWVPELCPDLAAICLTCLEKDPDRRYASAAGLADDLDRWLRHESISVQPAGRAAQIARWVRRRPVVTGLSAVFAMALLGGTAATTWQWRRAAASERRTEELLYAANVNLAQADWRAGNTARLRGLLHEIRSQGEPGFGWWRMPALPWLPSLPPASASPPRDGMDG